MNKPQTPPDLYEKQVDIHYLLYSFLPQMMKYYAKMGYSFKSNSRNKLTKIIDFNIALKICQERYHHADTFLNECWNSLVYVWATKDIEDFITYLETNTSEENWSTSEDSLDKCAIDYLIDFCGKEKAQEMNLAIISLSKRNNAISGIQDVEDNKTEFGTTPRQRTINYLKYLTNYFNNLNNAYEEEYTNTEFPVVKNWHSV
jgi:hypothetical protein